MKMTIHDDENIKYLFEPRSLAIIGVSRDKHKIGRTVLKNVIAGGMLISKTWCRTTTMPVISSFAATLLAIMNGVEIIRPETKDSTSKSVLPLFNSSLKIWRFRQILRATVTFPASPPHASIDPIT
jgi:hypothetical protein